MSTFDEWAEAVSSPPRCDDCGSLLRTGSKDFFVRVVECPMCEVPT